MYVGMRVTEFFPHAYLTVRILLTKSSVNNLHFSDGEPHNPVILRDEILCQFVSLRDPSNTLAVKHTNNKQTITQTLLQSFFTNIYDALPSIRTRSCWGRKEEHCPWYSGQFPPDKWIFLFPLRRYREFPLKGWRIILKLHKYTVIMLNSDAFLSKTCLKTKSRQA